MVESVSKAWKWWVWGNDEIKGAKSYFLWGKEKGMNKTRSKRQIDFSAKRMCGESPAPRPSKT